MVIKKYYFVRRLAVAAFAVLSSLSCYAGSHVISPTWFVNKSGLEEPADLIHICARPTIDENQQIKGWSPGHVYIVLQPASAANIVALGAFPSGGEGAKNKLINALYSDGELKPEFASIRGEHCVVVNANPQQIDQAAEIILDVGDKKPYILGIEDCVALAERIVELLGLKVESGRFTRPKQFVLGLVEANKLENE